MTSSKRLTNKIGFNIPNADTDNPAFYEKAGLPGR
jgi:hypothetical protein